MQHPFFYTDKAFTGKEVTLNEETSKHVAQVLRMTAGQKVQLTDGKGLLYTAVIYEAHKKHTTVQIISEERFSIKNQKITIGISPVKNVSRLEWFLEKVTEIGIHEIIILRCHRSERDHVKYERLQNILISAMLQSRQVFLPVLTGTKDFIDVIKTCNIDHKYIAHCIEGDKKNLLQYIQQNAGDSITLIGPEGDFTPEEVSLALSNNFMAVSLGTNRLRTETAGITACILMNAVKV